MADENVSGFISFAKSTLVFFIGNTLSKIITIALLPLTPMLFRVTIMVTSTCL